MQETSLWQWFSSCSVLIWRLGWDSQAAPSLSQQQCSARITYLIRTFQITTERLRESLLLCAPVTFSRFFTEKEKFSWAVCLLQPNRKLLEHTAYIQTQPTSQWSKIASFLFEMFLLSIQHDFKNTLGLTVTFHSRWAVIDEIRCHPLICDINSQSN